MGVMIAPGAMAFTLLAHGGEDVLEAEEDAPEVDVDDALELVAAELLGEVLLALDGRVVEEGVDPAVGPRGLGHVARDLVRTLTLLGDPGVVAGALVERGEAGRAELRDLLAAWSEPGAVLLRRDIGRGELPAGLDTGAVVDSWLGYALYHVVFLESAPTDADPAGLVDALPYTAREVWRAQLCGRSR